MPKNWRVFFEISHFTCCNYWQKTLSKAKKQQIILHVKYILLWLTVGNAKINWKNRVGSQYEADNPLSAVPRAGGVIEDFTAIKRCLTLNYIYLMILIRKPSLNKRIIPKYIRCHIHIFVRYNNSRQKCTALNITRLHASPVSLQ